MLCHIKYAIRKGGPECPLSVYAFYALLTLVVAFLDFRVLNRQGAFTCNVLLYSNYFGLNQFYNISTKSELAFIHFCVLFHSPSNI